MVSVIISYCSNERIFIDAVIQECLKFSTDIVVAYGNHLYDGTPEDMDHIREKKKLYPSVKWVCYEVDVSSNVLCKKGVFKRPTAYWHNLARWTGAQALTQKGWVFVIDADEIPDGNLVKDWLDVSEDAFNLQECFKCANYWYFKSPTNQAQTLEDSVLLIHSKYLTEENIFGDNERDYLIPASGCALNRETRGLHGAVMFHHFSWVRPKNELIHKLKSWGHANDIFKNVDVDKLIAYIYKDDNVNDIVHGYQYTKVPNRFNLNVSY